MSRWIFSGIIAQHHGGPDYHDDWIQNAADFADPLHMNASGAKVFSELIANKLNAPILTPEATRNLP